MSGADWVALAVVAAGCGAAGWLVSGVTAGLRGGDRRGALRWFDAGVTALVLLLAFALLTLT